MLEHTQALPASTDATPPLLATVDDVAAHTQVHPRTVRAWLASGRLKYIKLGRSVRIRRADLEAMLSGSEVSQ